MTPDHPDYPDHPDHAAPSNTPPTADRRALLAGIGGLAAGALLVGTKNAHAGPLNPPAGPITSTPGPEPRIAINETNTPGDSDSLFKITQPGSYYLTGNITGVANKHGIEIAANGVTVDLMGFSIISTGLDGVFSGGGRVGIRIHNGHIRSARTGIHLVGDANVIVQNMTVTACGSSGIVAGRNAIVDSCVVDGCANTAGGSGISTGGESVISNCSLRAIGGTAVNAPVTGISSGASSRIRDCIVVSVSSQLRALGMAVNSDSIAENCSILGVSGGTDPTGVTMNAGASVVRCMFFSTIIAILGNSDQLSVLGNTINGVGNTVGVRLSSFSRCHIEGNRFEGLATGVDGVGGTAVVVRNVFRSVVTLTAALGATSVVGPVINAGNAATATSPIANIVY